MTETFEELPSEELLHIGILRQSGRYPWGSGESPYQRARDFKGTIDQMMKDGLTEGQIIQGLGLVRDNGRPWSSTDLRDAIAISTEEIRAANVGRAKEMSGRGLSNLSIAEHLGTNESTVRGWLKQSEEAKAGSIKATAEILKQHIDEKQFLDAGKGTELFLGVAPSKLRVALARLRDEGYEQFPIKGPQLGTGNLTEYKIMAKPGTTFKEARDALVEGRVQNIKEYSTDNGQTFKRPDHEPVSVNSKRIQVRYGEDGGGKMDGVIELRRGVPDLDLGANRYAQVRVAVDGTHYLKGMAMYANDLPDGVDIRFNTPKKKSEVTSDLDAMKPLKDDPSNRFGASTYPRVYTDKSGKEKTSPLNIVGTKPGQGNEEGKWDTWSRNLSSQFLAKQSVKLANEQLMKTRAAKEKDLQEILKLTNPVVKKDLLLKFAEGADADAANLKAAHLPGQSSHVILPLNAMRPNEIYAPNFNTGDKVVLVRYPHGGPFEIPELTVNNNVAAAKKVFTAPGNKEPIKDAVGIHHSVAEKLSGADFDGDAVLVIPNNDGKIKSKPGLPGLSGFDPKIQYKIADDDTTTPRMSKKSTQTEMGKITNLIMDMTVKGASDAELAHAVKHSMVVIDAEKHGLDYKRSEAENGIKSLKTKYQGGPRAGRSTFLTRAGADERVPERKYLTGKRGIDPKTGERVFVETDGHFVNKNGVRVDKKTAGSAVDFVKDARDLLSDKKNPQEMEVVYAAHSNAMKDLANKARLASLDVPSPKQSPAAKAFYSKEVASLENHLKNALSNAPLERRAQIIGNAAAKARIDANPHLEKDEIKRIKFEELERARITTGAAKLKIPITDREWEAIQANAFSATKLSEILRHADKDRVRELATPRARTTLTPGQLARAKQMAASGRPTSEIAAELGIPRSTLADNLANS